MFIHRTISADLISFDSIEALGDTIWWKTCDTDFEACTSSVSTYAEGNQVKDTYFGSSPSMHNAHRHTSSWYEATQLHIPCTALTA